MRSLMKMGHLYMNDWMPSPDAQSTDSIETVLDHMANMLQNFAVADFSHASMDIVDTRETTVYTINLTIENTREHIRARMNAIDNVMKECNEYVSVMKKEMEALDERYKEIKEG